MVQSSILVAIAVTLLIVAISTLFFVWQQKSYTKKTVLLLGITDAGKTALYMLLRFGKKAVTATSMKENQGPVTLAGKSYDLVDVPGHERLRFRFADFLPATRTIVFVVDASTITRQIRQVAEYMYDILVHPQTQKSKLSILVACNKSELITALPAPEIQQLLEAEINRLRTTRSAAVESQDGQDRDVYLGYEGESFAFDHIDNRIAFVSCSVESDETKDLMDDLLPLL